MIDKIIKMETYWHWRTPIKKPRNANVYDVEDYPKEISFNKIDSYGFVGTNIHGDNLRTVIGRQDLFSSFNKCLNDMIKHQKKYIEQLKDVIIYQENELIRIKSMKKKNE